MGGGRVLSSGGGREGSIQWGGGRVLPVGGRDGVSFTPNFVHVKS